MTPRTYRVSAVWIREDGSVAQVATTCAAMCASDALAVALPPESDARIFTDATITIAPEPPARPLAPPQE